MSTPYLFTTIGAIRACLGLEESDIPDKFFTESNINQQLMLDLDSWYKGSWSDDFANSGIDPASSDNTQMLTMTEAEKKGYYLSVYSMWFAAYLAINTLMVMPQKISDGKDEIQRFSRINFEKVLARIIEERDRAKQIIKSQQNASSTTGVLGAVGAPSTGYDVVTGQ